MEKISFICLVISVIVALVTGIFLLIGTKMAKSSNPLVRGFGRLIVVSIFIITAVTSFYILYSDI